MNKILSGVLVLLVLLAVYFTHSTVDPPIDDRGVAWLDSEAESELSYLEYSTPSPLKYLVIHCTATFPNNTWTPEQLKTFFKEERGWVRPGYYLYITYDGKIHPLWYGNIDDVVEYAEITNGARGFNRESMHISYQGGVDTYGQPKDTRTKEQKRAIHSIIEIVQNANPSVQVLGHRDLHEDIKKACPSFDVRSEL